MIFCYLLLCLNTAGCVNSIDSDQTLCSVPSDLGLCCTFRSVRLNTKGEQGTSRKQAFFSIYKLVELNRALSRKCVSYI